MVDCGIEPDNPECTGDSDGGIIDTILGFFDDVGKTLGEIVNGIISIPGKIIDGLIGVLTTIADGIGAIVDFFAGLLSAVGDLLVDIFKFLFVPSDDFWSNQYDNFKSIFDSKLGTGSFESILSSLKGVGSAGLSNVVINLLGYDMTIIDFGFIGSVLPFLHMFIRGMALWWVVNYCINNVYKVVRKDDIEE